MLKNKKLSSIQKRFQKRSPFILFLKIKRGCSKKTVSLKKKSSYHVKIIKKRCFQNSCLKKLFFFSILKGIPIFCQEKGKMFLYHVSKCFYHIRFPLKKCFPLSLIKNNNKSKNTFPKNTFLPSWKMFSRKEFFKNFFPFFLKNKNENKREFFYINNNNNKK